MIDNALHDEIRFHGSTLIVDTCDLGERYNLRYETMALRHGGKEIERVRTATLEEAKCAHSIMLKTYKSMAEELTGKYAILRDDLRAAADAARSAVRDLDDGGTCNMDAPALALPRWNRKMVEQAAREAGLSGCFDWNLFGKRYVVFPTPNVGQARRNEVAAETMTDYLRRRGYDAFCYSQMD